MLRRCSLLPCVAFSLAATFGSFAMLSAADAVEFEVAAGSHDRRDVPIAVPITSKVANLGNAVTTSAGDTFISQVTGPALLSPANVINQLHFVLPAEKSGESKTLKTTKAEFDAPPVSFRWVE